MLATIRQSTTTRQTMRGGGAVARMLTLTFAVAALSLLPGTTYAAKTKIIHSFAGDDGRWPSGGLIMGPDGVLYGTTRVGGANDKGTVYSLTPSETGARWKHNVLHDFDGTDGSEPFSDLARGQDGTLYGTTSAGAQANGTVFALMPPTTGSKWKLQTLHVFTGSATDGGIPFAGVVRGPDGSLFGTTIAGGTASQGTAYMLSPPTRGNNWQFRLLTSFVSGTDGGQPFGMLTLDSQGSLFGTTTRGGTVDCDCGTVFMLVPPQTGNHWHKAILHRFVGHPDGSNPYSQLVIDQAGALLGSTYLGGTLDHGTVFRLSPPAPPRAKWSITNLTSFDRANGYGPLFYGPLVVDDGGAIYGTTQNSTASETGGTVFRLTPVNSKRWRQTSLHTFGATPDGFTPDAAVTRDTQGRLFGTTVLGGTQGLGAVFVVTP